ncbi:MAG TPA: sugar transferase [Verrucomicrobiae bacterium]|jgi:exopolysaccharide biosynthesis polyprenyl glycosylphosphotransferase|nr:sugar transferase [Verrucomicrobiae bacterium]
MSEQEINALLFERFTATQTPWGRWRLNARSQMKRLSWRGIVFGAEFLKRVVDIIFSGIALILLAPLFAIVALCIKLEDRGPIFFAQRRVGKWGREFRMFKFRSMGVDAEERLQAILKKNEHAAGVTFKLRDDPRITKAGKWLRKFSIDEFPQFYNVLIGDMSLVGPRPPVPREVAKYTPADRRRLEVTPGLTCFWQIGGRSEIDFPQQVQLDVEYIESQSFWLDLKILVKTVPAVLLGRGAC